MSSDSRLFRTFPAQHQQPQTTMSTESISFATLPVSSSTTGVQTLSGIPALPISVPGLVHLHGITPPSTAGPLPGLQNVQTLQSLPSFPLTQGGVHLAPLARGNTLTAAPSLLHGMVDGATSLHTSVGIPYYPASSVVEEQLRMQEKKRLKRAANRKSAQLSRMRKKAYIEELQTNQKSVARSAELLEYIPVVVLAHDYEGSISYASPSSRYLLKYDEADILGKSFEDLVTAESWKAITGCINKLLSKRDPTSRKPATFTDLIETATIDLVDSKGKLVSCEYLGRLNESYQNQEVIGVLRLITKPSLSTPSNGSATIE